MDRPRPLLAGAGERATADALSLAAVASGASRPNGAPAVALSGIWALPADMAAARSASIIRHRPRGPAGCSASGSR